MGSIDRVTKVSARCAAAAALANSGKPYIGAYSFYFYEPTFRGQGKGVLIDMGGPRPRRELELMTTKQAARLLHLSVSTLAYFRMNGRQSGTGPAYFFFGWKVFYDIVDLKEWQAQRSLRARLD